MSEIDSLLERNRVNKEDTENHLVDEMFISLVNTSPIIEKFSMWLFVGTGATGALLITQINSIISNMSVIGFKVCIFMLIVSSIFAFVAKYFSLKCQTQHEGMTMLSERTKHIIAKYKEDKIYIEESVKKHDIDELDTNIDINKLVEGYIRPFPKWIQWEINYSFKKNESEGLPSYYNVVQAYCMQAIFTFLQALAFIGFMCSGGWFAGSL